MHDVIETSSARNSLRETQGNLRYFKFDVAVYDLHFSLSGVKIRSALTLKNFQRQLTAVGETGRSGMRVREPVALAFQCRRESVIIQRLCMADLSALENERDIKLATSIRAQKTSQVFERNSVRGVTIK